MGEMIQPGARVDEDVYESFKSWVRENHGSRRGAVGQELERAMKDRMTAGERNDRLVRIESELATVKALLAEQDAPEGQTADGGAVLPSRSAQVQTHTVDDEPPHPKASVASKAEWLAAQADNEQVHIPSDLGGLVRETWAFGDEATERVVEAAVERLDLVPHPANPEILVTEDYADEIRAKQQADREREAAETMDELDEADHGK